MITTVLFDLDGIIIDSWPFIVATFDHTITKFNLNREAFAHPKMRSCTLREALIHLGGSEEQYEEFVSAHLDFQAKNMHLLRAFPDACEVLRVFEPHYDTGVVSNRKKNAHALLDRFDLCKYIELIIGAEDVKRPKPHPEGIIQAMDHFGSLPEETAMIGDTSADILAGKGAGVTTIGVHRDGNMADLVDAEPDFIVESLRDLYPIFDPQGLYASI